MPDGAVVVSLLCQVKSSCAAQVLPGLLRTSQSPGHALPDYESFDLPCHPSNLLEIDVRLTMPNAIFGNSSSLVKVVQRYDSNLSLCLDCSLIWLSDYKGKKNDCLAQRDLRILAYCIKRLNNLLPSVEQLTSWKIFISHGLCRPCMRSKMMESYRRRQKRAGYHPCYATAVHGHCSQLECAYYDSCVVDQNQLRDWDERKRRLLTEEICRRTSFRSTT